MFQDGLPEATALGAALLAYNLPSARLGDPTQPYLLSGIGYPALVAITALFAVRFLRTCEVQRP